MYLQPREALEAPGGEVQVSVFLTATVFWHGWIQNFALEICLLAPTPPLSFASLRPLENQNVTGWLISPQLDDSGPPMTRPEPQAHLWNQM